LDREHPVAGAFFLGLLQLLLLPRLLSHRQQ
jgi:hypothetical protein